MQQQKSPSYIAQFYTQCVQCICCHNVSVRPSVCHDQVLYQNQTDIVTVISPSSSLIISVFC